MARQLAIEWTADPTPTTLEHMRIDHRRADILVSQEFLHGTDIGPSSNRWVATLWRKVWQLPRLAIPAWRIACFTAFCNTLSDRWWRRPWCLDDGCDET